LDGAHRAAYLLSKGSTHAEVVDVAVSEAKDFTPHELLKVVQTLEQAPTEYCLLRPSLLFPLNMRKGKDIDIALPSWSEPMRENWLQHICAAWPVSEGYRVAADEPEQDVYHVDVFQHDKLHLRYDLNGTLASLFEGGYTYTRTVDLGPGMGPRVFTVPHVTVDKALRSRVCQKKPWHRTFNQHFFPLSRP
jgi:hypothetical protein